MDAWVINFLYITPSLQIVRFYTDDKIRCTRYYHVRNTRLKIREEKLTVQKISYFCTTYKNMFICIYMYSNMAVGNE